MVHAPRSDYGMQRLLIMQRLPYIISLPHDSPRDSLLSKLLARLVRDRSPSLSVFRCSDR